MNKRKVILDCDPGQDDAVSLLLALASPDELDVLGITTVAGNVPLELTQRNARIICDIAGRPDVPVYAGCDRPLKRAPFSAEYVHGETGINGMDVFEPKTPLQQQHGVDFIIQTLQGAEPNSITLVPTGPLTNIATVISRAPELLGNVQEIVLMGGAMREGGNVTPSAEFNIYVDPHAADTVFSCGRPITAIGLDVSHQVLTTPDRLAAIKAIDNPVADAIHGMLGFFDRYDREKYGSEGAPLHDPGTVMYLLNKAMFESKQVNLSVETDSELTIGHTAVDFWHVTNKTKNTNWTFQIDTDLFYETLIERIQRYS